MILKGAAQPGADLVRDASLPALVIHRDALEHNIAWMQDFVTRSGAVLARTVKTSMAPALFRRQLEQGAWGLTPGHGGANLHCVCRWRTSGING